MKQSWLFWKEESLYIGRCLGLPDTQVFQQIAAAIGQCAYLPLSSYRFSPIRAPRERAVAHFRIALPLPPICQERRSRLQSVLRVMARKTGARSIYDTHNNVALADGEQHSPGDIKEKLSKVREVVPSMSKDQICMALRTYDYDVNATITAISENGPEEALREWNCAGNKVKPPSKNRKRKKKKKDAAAGSVPEGPDIGAGDEARKDSDSSKLEEQEKTEELPPADSPPDDSALEVYKHNGSEIEKPAQVSYGWGDDEPPELFKKNEVKFDDVVHTDSKSRSKPNHSHNGNRSKSSRSKNGSDIKFTDASVTTTSTLPKKTCLEKSLKDLSRQTVALQRVQVLLEDELHKAERAIKAAFAEVQKLLNDRQAQLEAEMEKVKTDARAMLQRRQKLAAELKARSEMASTLPDYELMELRDDIKHFVVERKYDEELGKTVRFSFSKDRVEREIKELGQAVHVRDPYTCRRLSLSSGASSSYPDSSYQVSAASSPVCRSQYWALKGKWSSARAHISPAAAEEKSQVKHKHASPADTRERHF
ncbi:spermatogenesis-associated serine-rich protein 2 [Ixodes scapularis]